MATLQAPPSFWVEVREFLEFMSPVVAWCCCALKLRPWLPWLDEAAALHSVEAKGHDIMAFLVDDLADPLRQQLVLIDPRWWHLWVALLLHVRDHCTGRECQCILFPHCQRYYWQWTHLRSCRETGCQAQDCTLLRALLMHNWQCDDEDFMDCPLCEDVECHLGTWITYTENRDFYRAEGWHWKCSVQDLFD